jgi:hypothetical protein
MKGILLSSPVSCWSYDNLSSVSQNVLKFYQQLTGEERRIPFIFDDFHFFRSRVIGNPIFRHIKSNNSGTAKVKIVKMKGILLSSPVSC